MLWETLNTARDLGRLHEIASVLVRHGLGDVLRRIGVAPFLERAGRALHWKAVEGLAAKEPQVRLREAFEEMGPTFVKLGQILAGRRDLLPPAWTDELGQLFERAQPAPFAEVHAQLVADLGAPPEQVFARFDAEPLAAASIAQVHRAALPDGTEVVLKVRRPGIADVVENDLRLIRRLAELIEREVPDLRRYRPRQLARQFARSLRHELDLRLEGRNAERLSRNLGSEPRLVVPPIHWQWTRERLLVMDFLSGPSLEEWLRAGTPGPADPKELARIGADTVLRTVLLDGFFHADPHPGNLILLRDGRLGLVDFGMMGSLSRSRRLEFLGFLQAVVERRPETMADILLAWSEDGRGDVEGLTADCNALVERYWGAALDTLDMRALYGDISELLRENDLFLPHEVALLLKVFVTLEGLGRRLDPEFVISARAAPFARRAWRAAHSPVALLRHGLGELRTVADQLPRALRRALRQVRRGKLQLEVGMPNLEEFGRHVERSANRVTIGMITSALIVGTAVALTASRGEGWFGPPTFALLGFLTSLAAGVWLLWLIARSTKR